MRKKRIVFDNWKKEILLSLFSLFVFSGCSANHKQMNRLVVNSAEIADTIMRSAIGDSIYHIIAEAKKIKAEAITLSNDSLKRATFVMTDVKSKYKPLVLFLLSSPLNYQSDNIVYGKFMPCFTLTFTKKKESCIINFDFGLQKWEICDSKGRMIKKFDYPSIDMLRFANILFPNNNFFKTLINAYKK